jgi:hypothetical protein
MVHQLGVPGPRGGETVSLLMVVGHSGSALLRGNSQWVNGGAGMILLARASSTQGRCPGVEFNEVRACGQISMEANYRCTGQIILTLYGTWLLKTLELQSHEVYLPQSS